MLPGFGQFGPIEMGGMVTVVKVREGLARNDSTDPGWYRHPPGTVSYALDGTAPNATKAATATSAETILKVRKPGGHAGHR
jgi:hypothetical protein